MNHHLPAFIFRRRLFDNNVADGRAGAVPAPQFVEDMAVFVVRFIFPRAGARFNGLGIDDLAGHIVPGR